MSRFTFYWLVSVKSRFRNHKP